MKLGLVGLGRMGSNMARRLAEGGHHVLVYNRTVSKAYDLAKEVHGISATDSPRELVAKLPRPRTVWIMLPAGQPTKQMAASLTKMLSAGDTIIDGSNSHYTETIKTAEKAKSRGICFLDSGTSGGIWGLKEGYSLMVGGDKKAFDRARPIFRTLAPGESRGWGWVGPSGAGHFVKMVHNGIEYGMMQSYAEGFEILREKKDFDLDLHNVAEIWRYGSVVRSWLLDLTSKIVSDERRLEEIKGWVEDSGEGRWSVAQAIEENVPAPVITLSLIMRLVSRQDESFAAKLLAAMREEFGGHAVKLEK